MDTAHRQPAPHLISDLYANAAHYSFYRAVALLLRKTNYNIDEQILRPGGPSLLKFLSNPRLGFAKSDIETIEQIGIKNGQPTYGMTVNFLGFSGGSSPFPDYLLEGAAWSRLEEGVQKNLYDFFSNRLVWLFYLILRKYRYDARYIDGASDQFSGWMFSLIGIGDPKSRGETNLPWARLLTYLGVIAARARSAESVSGVVAHAFGLSKVRIQELEQRIVSIPEDQLSRLGQANCRLGEDMTIGSRVKDYASKFTIILEDLDYRQFRNFLPTGRCYAQLRELIEFLLKDQLAFDVNLVLKQGETPPFILGDSKSGNIGWSTFIGNNVGATDQSVNLQVRA